MDPVIGFCLSLAVYLAIFFALINIAVQVKKVAESIHRLAKVQEAAWPVTRSER